MDYYGDLARKETDALRQVFLEYGLDKADLDKVVAGAESAELGLAALQGPVGDGIRVGPIKAA